MTLTLSTREAPPANGLGRLVVKRLAAIHMALALVAAAGAIEGSLRWPHVLAGGKPLEVDLSAQVVAWAAVLYMAVTAALELRSAWYARQGRLMIASRSRVLLFLHAWVCVEAIRSIVLGANSLALLAGLDIDLGAVAVVSLMSVLVNLAQRWALGSRADRSDWHRSEMFPDLVLWFAGQSAALFLVVALAYLEMQPQPHAPRPHVAPPKGPDLTAVPDDSFPPAKPAAKSDQPADTAPKADETPAQPGETTTQPAEESPPPATKPAEASP